MTEQSTFFISNIDVKKLFHYYNTMLQDFKIKRTTDSETKVNNKETALITFQDRKKSDNF